MMKAASFRARKSGSGSAGRALPRLHGLPVTLDHRHTTADGSRHRTRHMDLLAD